MTEFFPIETPPSSSSTSKDSMDEPVLTLSSTLSNKCRSDEVKTEDVETTWKRRKGRRSQIEMLIFTDDSSQSERRKLSFLDNSRKKSIDDVDFSSHVFIQLTSVKKEISVVRLRWTNWDFLSDCSTYPFDDEKRVNRHRHHGCARWRCVMNVKQRKKNWGESPRSHQEKKRKRRRKKRRKNRQQKKKVMFLLVKH